MEHSSLAQTHCWLSEPSMKCFCSGFDTSTSWALPCLTFTQALPCSPCCYFKRSEIPYRHQTAWGWDSFDSRYSKQWLSFYRIDFRHRCRYLLQDQFLGWACCLAVEPQAHALSKLIDQSGGLSRGRSLLGPIIGQSQHPHSGRQELLNVGNQYYLYGCLMNALSPIAWVWMG